LLQQLNLPMELMDSTVPHVLLSVAVLASPAAACWLGYKLLTITATNKRTSSPMRRIITGSSIHTSTTPSRNSTASAAPAMPSFTHFSYSFLPLVWSGLLAYYEGPLLTELGQVLPQLAAGAYIPADIAATLPTLGPASADVVAAVQGVTLVAGTCWSLMLAGSIAAGRGNGGSTPRDLAGDRDGAAAGVDGGWFKLQQGMQAMVLAIAYEWWYLLLAGN
jgi:hypothetical protein